MKQSIRALFIGILSCVSVSTYATIHVVQLSSVLTPDTLTNVVVGDTIRFQWVSEGHSMMFTSVPNGVPAENFSISSSDPIYDYKVPAEGPYSYTCYPHGNFKGYFVAQAATGISAHKGSHISILKTEGNTYLVRSSKGSAYNCTVKAFDLSGRMVYNANADLSKGHIADLDALSNGIYIFKVSYQDQTVFEQKILKL